MENEAKEILISKANNLAKLITYLRQDLTTYNNAIESRRQYLNDYYELLKVIGELEKKKEDIATNINQKEEELLSLGGIKRIKSRFTIRQNLRNLKTLLELVRNDYFYYTDKWRKVALLIKKKDDQISSYNISSLRGEYERAVKEYNEIVMELNKKFGFSHKTISTEMGQEKNIVPLIKLENEETREN